MLCHVLSTLRLPLQLNVDRGLLNYLRIIIVWACCHITKFTFLFMLSTKFGYSSCSKHQQAILFQRCSDVLLCSINGRREFTPVTCVTMPGVITLNISYSILMPQIEPFHHILLISKEVYMLPAGVNILIVNIFIPLIFFLFSFIHSCINFPL